MLPRKLIRFVVLLLYVFGTHAAVAAQCGTGPSHGVGLLYINYISAPDASYAQIDSLAAEYPNVPIMDVVNFTNDYTATLSPFSDGTASITAMKAAGIKVLAYVPTCYGGSAGDAINTCNTTQVGYDYPNESQSTIQTMIQQYFTFYSGFDGIFFDEMASYGINNSYTGCIFGSTGNCVTLYQNLTSFVTTNYGSTKVTVGNMGEPTTATYYNASPPAVTIFNVWENNTWPAASDVTSAGACLSPSRCSVITYGLTYNSGDWATMYENSNWVFTTDASPSNAYVVVPTDLATQIAALSAYNGTPSTPCIILQGFVGNTYHDDDLVRSM